MSKQEFRSFDVKLTDGRYFKNVLICNDCGVDENIEEILDNQYTDENGEVINIEMDLFHVNDDECDNILAVIHSDDIEYLCNPYRDREVI